MDPFRIYGHGLNAFFRMVRMLSLFFIVMTLFGGMFLMISYNREDPMRTLDELTQLTFTQILSDYSFGNIGEAKPICSSQYFS